MTRSWPLLPGWLGKEVEGFHKEVLSLAQSTRGSDCAGLMAYSRCCTAIWDRAGPLGGKAVQMPGPECWQSPSSACHLPLGLGDLEAVVFLGVVTQCLWPALHVILSSPGSHRPP